MPTKKQHYVPRVYLKAWETKVETSKEPTKKFDGVYYFENRTLIGEGSTRERILWEPHLYTIWFKHLYLARSCPRVYTYFVDEVHKAMTSNQPFPIYGKLGKSIIKTKQSVRKHLFDIEDWDFFYYDGRVARKKAILSRVNDMTCYILEDSFDSFYESKWESIMHTFITAVRRAYPIPDAGDRIISEKAAMDMLEFFFMMVCRSPQFPETGVYSKIRDILIQSFGCQEEITEMMDAVWFSELYKMFFKQNSGFYHNIIEKVLDKCQFILFETYPDAGTFITSDNPAFQHLSMVESENMNGYYFPLTPNHLLMIVKGCAPVNVVDYRMAKTQTVQKINRIIASHSNHIVVSKEKNLAKLL